MTFNYALSSLLLPPTSLIALTIIGVLALKRRRAFGLVLIVGSQLLLLALSMPRRCQRAGTVAGTAARFDRTSSRRAQAIVVLGGGRNLGSPEWGGETVNDYTLRRARYGARLARETGLPVYVSGGKPTGGQLAEGTLMRELIAREFNSAGQMGRCRVRNDARTSADRGARSEAAADQPHRRLLPTRCICRARSARSSWPAWRSLLLRPGTPRSGRSRPTN